MRTIAKVVIALGVTFALSSPLGFGPQAAAAETFDNLGLLWARSDGHNATTWSVRWSPDGSMISQTFFDNTTVVWNSTTGKRIVKLGSHANSTAESRTRCDWNVTCTIPSHLPTRVSAWSLDGKFLAIGGDDRTIWVFNTTNWQLAKALTGHEASVLTLDFSPDGRYLASGSGTDKVSPHNTDGENMIKIWDFARGVATVNLTGGGLTGHKDSVMEVRWSPDGSRLVSASDDKTLKMWNTTSWSLMFTLRGHALGVLSVDWSPDGRTLISGSREYMIKIWDSATGKVSNNWTTVNCIRSVDWHQNGTVIVTAGVSVAHIAIRNATTGAVLQTIMDNVDSGGNPIGAIMSARWSPDGNKLAIASGREATIRVYEFGLAKPKTAPLIPEWVPGVLAFISLIVIATLVTYFVAKRRVRKTERR